MTAKYNFRGAKDQSRLVGAYSAARTYPAAHGEMRAKFLEIFISVIRIQSIPWGLT